MSEITETPKTKLRSWLDAQEKTAFWLAGGSGVSKSVVSRAINGERCGPKAALAISSFIQSHGGEVTPGDILEDVHGFPTPADPPPPTEVAA